MPFAKRQALINALILLSIGSLVSACASAPLIVAGPSACSSLVSPTLKADVGAVDLPPANATAGQLWTAFDGQTGKLDVANLYKRAAIDTIERCEARDAATVARLKAPWWKKPFVRAPASGTTL